MRTVRAAVSGLAAMLVIAGVAGCTDPRPPRPPTTTVPSTGGALATYSQSGGNCPPEAPGCGPVQVNIGRDGDWRASVGATQRQGQLDAASIGLLRNLVAHGLDTLDALQPLPPGRACPSAWDGTDVTFTFPGGSRPVSVTNCDRQDVSRSRDVPGDNGLLIHTERLAQRLARGASADETLIRWQATGGHCREICPTHRVQIRPDGRWTAMIDLDVRHGQLDAETTQRLRTAVRNQFASLADLGPSTGCPSAYDGRDVVITYDDGQRVGAVANCILDFEGNALISFTEVVVAGLIQEAGG